ncbi:hypothetical protein MSG28_014268 [Choristoneura fumiferana]|uniref:Uncharacterized protein n=1 Tax=Choristoneura fumiferana TaxID=7141 RepID=A0ACC0JGP8_CHOFU|nr:hypothetical protein MSG28_014268 [Choristoneura fumiferana]
MRRAMLGVSLKDRIRNETSGSRLVVSVKEPIAAGVNEFLSTDCVLANGVLRGLLAADGCEGLKTMWWRAMEETYIHQWTAISHLSQLRRETPVYQNN